ncbi:hypothetical protein [Streptomyces sp. cg40]|uniref:hypothetical protein n=1 Tax=Streptomyces sp. cg40 TaxID=3419764 RepID=UPI003D05EF0B
MVRQLLGEPDAFRGNPYSRAAPRIRLYRVDRVEAAERSAEFRAVTAAAARRSAAARSVAARVVAARVVARRRRREVLTRIATEPIDVPRLAPQELAALAVEYRDRRDGAEACERPGQGPLPDSGHRAAGSTDPGGLDRWKVDCLRHRLARYEELLKGLHGGAGRAAAEELLRRRVYAAIAETYPLLARECERQLSEREFSPPPQRARSNSDAGPPST